MKIKFLVIFALAVSGCSNVPVEIGSGPIRLSAEAQDFYEKYSSSTSPIVFVATKDGEFFQGYYCEDLSCRGGSGTARAISECQYMSKGKRCYVYDRNGTIVWDQEKTS
jgi:hypothetical protein